MSVRACVLRTVSFLLFFRFQFWFLGEYAKINSAEVESNKK